MASNGFNITPKINLDGVSDFKNQVKQVSSQIALINSDFKANAAEMKASGKTAEGLEKNLKNLEMVYDAENKKLNIYQKELENIVATQGENSKAAIDMQIKVNQQSAAVSKAKDNLNKYAKEMNDSADETKKFGDEADKSGEKALKLGDIIKANLVSEGIVTGIKKLANVVKSVASGLVNIGKEAIRSYSDYEQLVGGVETLFKDSADIVKKYANNAYKTAGLSANEYMETVTSFSASLLQSLNGDTAKSAKIADMAITDMSDNANKMGTDISLIQNAYQGFAKQNYTMLDNLKLGYGGTKTEMERLLKDAEKISGIKYDINNLKDVYEAIHVIQGELGITEATANEANTTIAGSINAMKASWANLITGIADENADVPTLMQNFVDSIATVWENLKPRIRQTIDGIKKAISELWEKRGEIKDEFPELAPIIDAMEWVIDNKNLVIGAITAIIGAMVVGKIASFITTMVTLVSTLSAIPAVAGLASGAMTMLGTAFTFMTGPIGLIIAGIAALALVIKHLWDNNEEFRKAVIDIWENIKNFFSETWKAITGFFSDAWEKIKGIWNAVPGFFTGLLESIKSIFGSVVEWFKNAFSNGISKIFDVGKNLVKGLWDGINSAKDWVLDKIKGFGKGILNGIKGFFGIHSPSTVFRDQIGANLAKGLGIGFEDEMKNVTKDMTSSIPTDFDVAMNTRANKNGSVSGQNPYGTGTNIVQNITVNSPQPLNPTETAREIEKMSRELAWGL